MATKPTDTATTTTPDDNDIYLFMSSVNDETCRDLISFIIAKNLEKPKPKYLQIIINSNGGDLNAAFAVIDMMRGSPIPIRTVGLGMIASAAFAIRLLRRPPEPWRRRCRLRQGHRRRNRPRLRRAS